MEKNFIKWLSISDRYTKMHMDRCLAELGLNSSQYMYIVKVCQYPGITQNQFLGSFYLNPSNITRSLITLENEGFIIRKVSEEDRRTRRLYPTGKSKEAYRTICRIRADWERKIFQGMTQREKEYFIDLFCKVTGNIINENRKETAACKKPVE